MDSAMTLTDFTALRQAAAPAEDSSSPVGGGSPPPHLGVTYSQGNGHHFDHDQSQGQTTSPTTMNHSEFGHPTNTTTNSAEFAGFYDDAGRSPTGSSSPPAFLSLDAASASHGSTQGVCGLGSPEGRLQETGSYSPQTVLSAIFDGESCGSSMDGSYGGYSDSGVMYGQHQQQHLQNHMQQHQHHFQQDSESMDHLQYHFHQHHQHHMQHHQPTSFADVKAHGFNPYHQQFDNSCNPINPFSVPGSRSRGLSAGGKPKRKRVINKAQRSAANIRERRRMCTLNDAFEGLRERVPTFSYEKKLSRIETLKLAMTYIQFMTDVINNGSDLDLEALSSAAARGGLTCGNRTR